MFGQWSQVRPAERWDTAVAFLTLFGVMWAHAVLETARDTLFLSGIPATRLPLVYIGVAGVAFGISIVQQRRTRPPSGRRLSLWLVSASAVTAGLGFVANNAAPWTLYALYVWSAVAVSVVLAYFFVLLGERFTVTQAKRLYTVLGAGSVTGAIVGSGVASVLADVVPPRQLVLVAAGGLLVSSAGPLLLTGASRAPQPPSGAARELRLAWRVLIHPYAGRVAALALTAAMTFTLVDFVFKSTVVANVAPADLGVFFARCYLVLNILSLGAQVLLVQPVVRSLSVASAFAIVPALLSLGGASIAVGGALFGAVALKGVDGALRHSLHRTLGALLYLPMDKRLRAAAKITIDLVGQRVGQALASFLILLGIGLGAEMRQLGGAIVLMAAAWILQAVALRPHYFGLFRSSLDDAAERSSKNFPELDISSLESLMAALNSSSDGEVRAALSFLEEQGRTRAIPSLILYHPSPPVVVDALDILARSERVDFLPITDRLLDHEYAEVRAAALRARIARDPEESLLRDKSEIACPVVRATALVGLAGGGYISQQEADAEFQAIVETGSEIAKEALAKAITHRPASQFEAILSQLAADRSTSVRLAAVDAMAKRPSDSYLAALLPLLASRELRQPVRECLVRIGDSAFDLLTSALADGTVEASVAHHIPRTLSRFEPQRAARTLLGLLTDHSDGVVRYKALRGLGRLVAEDPELVLDRRQLEDFANRTAADMFRLIDWRMTLARGEADKPDRGTEAHGLLVTLLRDKERNARERLFRVLDLLFPDEDVATIYRGLSGRSPEMRANSRELLESFLRPPGLRTAVLGLIDDAPHEVLMMASGSLYAPVFRTYEEVLVQLLDAQGEWLRGLAVYQIGELKLADLRSQVTSLEAPEGGFLAQIIRRTTDSLQALPLEPVQ